MSGVAIRLVALLLLMTAAGCGTATGGGETPSPPEQGTSSRETDQRLPGEYVLTVEGDGYAAAREAFSRFGLADVRYVGGRIYLVRLERDPGPEAVTAAAATVPAIHAVQPNYRYRTFPGRSTPGR